ncbi:MAG TPA: rhamnulokinase family protein [Gaiellaceae bacterium]
MSATLAAVDIGGQSGRVALGRFDGERLSVAEVHRFPNGPVRVHGTLHWDVLRLFEGVLDGLRAAGRETNGRLASVGVDTWGVDFALLDRAGRLVQNPVHHRDARSERGFERALSLVPARELYERTGIQLIPLDTVFQLAAMVGDEDPALKAAETLLLVPDLLQYWLCGFVGCELTNATTTACFDPRAGAWDTALLERLGVPPRLFGDVVPPGTQLGVLRDAVADDTRLHDVTVVAPATHDTASAVASIPFREPGAAYVSAGTWSLVGLELPAPLIDDRTFAANLTNEGGAAGTTRLLRNVAGLWLLHECRRAWTAEGSDWSFAELVAMAEEAPPLRALVDPDDPALATPGDMPERIREVCTRTGQEPPETPGELVRCVLESIALAHRRALELLAEATGAPPPEVHVVGGGSRNPLLCQWTADAAALPVLAGPEEATVVGNLIVQAMALGELGSLDEGRELVRASFEPTPYEPRPGDGWDDAFGRFRQLRAVEAVAP